MTIRVSPSAENVPGVSGQSGKYLTTDGKSLSWGTPSSGLTLLSTTTLSGSTLTISNINQSYVNLYGIINSVKISGGGTLAVNGNGSTSITSYQQMQNSTTLAGFSNTSWTINANVNINSVSANENCFVFLIENYSSTSTYKPCSSRAAFYSSNTSTDYRWTTGIIATTSAITSLNIVAGNTYTGGTISLYGVR